MKMKCDGVCDIMAIWNEVACWIECVRDIEDVCVFSNKCPYDGFRQAYLD